MATTYNFPDHIKGDTYAGAQFEILEDAEALDITNAEIKMEMKRTPADASVLTLVVGNGITITDGPNGRFELDEQVVDVPAMQYQYEIRIKLESGRVVTYIKGSWRIVDNITTI